MARKARIEGEAAEEGDADALERIVIAFSKTHPDKWEAVRLCPTWHGIDTMVECLRS